MKSAAPGDCIYPDISDTEAGGSHPDFYDMGTISMVIVVSDISRPFMDTV